MQISALLTEVLGVYIHSDQLPFWELCDYTSLFHTVRCLELASEMCSQVTEIHMGLEALNASTQFTVMSFRCRRHRKPLRTQTVPEAHTPE